MNLAFVYPLSSNLGDDIQTLAALNLIGEAKFVDRDRLSLFNGTGKLILNGWFTHDPKNSFPPPSTVDCLPISMHITQKAQDHYRKNAGWFKGKKVLARDLYTDKFLKSIGVDSEFGGCLTLTLPRNEKERNGVIIVDADLEGAKLTHKTKDRVNHEKRRKDAQSLLNAYQEAELVITTRLHCALPCAAMGTPVILIGDNRRFSWMDKFVTISPSIEDFKANREELIQKAKNFDRSEIQKYSAILVNRVNEWLTSH